MLLLKHLKSGRFRLKINWREKSSIFAYTMAWSFAVKSSMISARFIGSQDIRRSGTHHNRVELPRMNRTLLEKDRCMLLQANMSKVFWAEEAHNASHIVNRSPASTIDFKTPNEFW